MTWDIFVINPGSTSTKLAVYKDTTEIVRQNIVHPPQELTQFAGVIDQLNYRFEKIEAFLSSRNLSQSDFDCIAARGGLLKPLESGTYRVNALMLEHLKAEYNGSHAANLGGLIADKLAQKSRIPAFIVDPVVVDELDPLARLTGRPEINRKSQFHALNHKAVAKRFAEKIGRPYDQINLIVAHLGGGITIGCHRQGKVVEVNNGLDGEGPYTPERAGTVQARQFGELILKQGWDAEGVGRALVGKAGLVAHLGTTDVREVEKNISDGDERARLVYDTMIYQVAKYIAMAAVPVSGKVDYIILTGGIAHSTYVTQKIEAYVKFIAPVIIMPGENELQALAEGAFRVLTGQELAREYE